MAVPTSSKSTLDLVGSVKILPAILWSLQEMLDLSRKLMDLGGQHCKSEAQDTAIVVNLQVWLAWRLFIVIQFKTQPRTFPDPSSTKMAWAIQIRWVNASDFTFTCRKSHKATISTRCWRFHKSSLVWLQKPNSLCLTSQRDCATWHKYTLFENWNVA